MPRSITYQALCLHGVATTAPVDDARIALLRSSIEVVVDGLVANRTGAHRGACQTVGDGAQNALASV